MALPEGTVTFLFSDVEGSTQLLERHPERMGAALARHYELFEQVIARYDGVIFETVGDAVYAAFAEPSDAVAAALDAQVSLATEDWGPIERIACRISIHTGATERRGDHYFGPALFRCARLQSIGYGEQTLLSARTADAARKNLPSEAGLRDLGLHRLKDLSEPEHVFMLLHPALREAFPPPKSVDLRPNNLPLQLSSFIGRDEEINAVSNLMAEHRLVTLAGPGGVGKTRLALQVAGNLIAELPDGAFLVDLAESTASEQIGAVASAALGLQPHRAGPVLDQLAEYVSSRQLLLVLDNLEQIQGAGSPILALLARAPSLRVLATSRIPLRVRGEHVYHVQPLGHEQFSNELSPAVTLFADRAAAVGHFALTKENARTVAEIGHQLEGLPLAIELAAARTAIFEPDELLARLKHRLSILTVGGRDLPERQRTLRAAIGWSFDLLDADAQAAFGRLAVFHGGWTLPAAEEICDADLDLIAGLMDAALIHRDGDRFRMLETIREYAVEVFANRSEATDIAARHADWYADWVEKLVAAAGNRHLETADEFKGLEPERENLASTIERLLLAGDGARARRFAFGLWSYWLETGYLMQGDTWVMQAIELPPPPSDAEHAWLLAVAGEFPRFRGDAERAIAIKSRSLDLGERAGERRTVAAVLHDLASAWADLGDLDRARSVAERSLAVRRELGDPWGIAHALDGLGEVELRAGNADRALELYTECAMIGESVDFPFASVGLAEAHLKLGELDLSAASLVPSIRGALGWNHALLSGQVLENAAALLLESGDVHSAAVVAGGLHELRRVSGFAIYDPPGHEKTMNQIRSDLPVGDFEGLFDRGRRMTLDAALRFADERCSLILPP